MSSSNKSSKDKQTSKNSSKESSKDKETSKTNDNTGTTDAQGEKSKDNTGTTDSQGEKSKDPRSTGTVTYINAEDYDNPESDDDTDIFYETENPFMVDAEDDYDIKQDRLQISRNDKNIFRKLESSLLTAPNPEAGDTPSIQQINNPIRTDEKQPQRDRRFNRKTASVQSDSQQSKAYNAWIASNKNKLKAITVEASSSSSSVSSSSPPPFLLKSSLSYTIGCYHTNTLRRCQGLIHFS